MGQAPAAKGAAKPPKPPKPTAAPLDGLPLALLRCPRTGRSLAWASAALQAHLRQLAERGRLRRASGPRVDPRGQRFLRTEGAPWAWTVDEATAIAALAPGDGIALHDADPP